MELGTGRRFVVVGHRGAAARAPENTAASILAGLEARADQIEIDVGLSADGRAVVLHDRTLDRTTDGRGPLSARPWATLRRLDAGSWFDPRFSGERLLDLDAALAVVRHRVPIVVEIKSSEPGGRDRLSPADRRIVPAVAASIRRTGGLEGITVSSSSWPLLGVMGEALPGVDLALTWGFFDRRDPLEWARRLGASAIHPDRRRCTRAFVDAAHASGAVVVPYTVNRAAELSRVLDAGADGAFTDDPAALRRLLARRSGERPRRDPWVLGIDQGSGGTRAVLLDGSGALVASHAVSLGGRRGALQDPDAVAASVIRAAAPILDQAPGPVAAAGLACQRGAVVLWRRSGGEPVAPVLSWRISAGYVPPAGLAEADATVSTRTGLTTRYPYGAVRVAALAAGEPALARALGDGSVVAGPLGAFLAGRLARREGTCDPSLAQRMLALDLTTRRWAPDLAEISGLPPSCLPPVLPSVADRGSLRIGRHRIPLLAVVGDVGAATRAIAEVGGPLGALVLGTGGFLTSAPRRIADAAPGLLTSLLFEDRAGPVYAVEGTVHGVAACLFEAARRGGFDDAIPEIAASRGAFASRAPAVVPALEGLGTPDWDLASRFEVEPGDWTGEEIVRGTLEALAARFGRIGTILRRAGLMPAAFAAAGGLAVSPHLTEAIGSRLGVPVAADPRPHRTAAGAALLAREGLE